MLDAIKNFLKDHFYILLTKDKFSPSTQASLRQLHNYWQMQALAGHVPAIADTGLKVFSQFEEDGKLLFIFSVIGMGSKTFIEIGADDGVNSNSANLAMNFGWHGLFIDGNETAIKRGQNFYRKNPGPWHYPPKFAHAMVTKENINEIISSAGFIGEIDLLSIDIDGNDYHIWDTITVVQPRVVIIETHVEFGMNNIVVPYNKDYVFPGRHPVYHGASPVAMAKLAARKGYRLVGANDYGFNTIYIRKDLAEALIPEVTVESILTHPSVRESYASFEPIKDWEYLAG